MMSFDQTWKNERNFEIVNDIVSMGKNECEYEWNSICDLENALRPEWHSN